LLGALSRSLHSSQPIGGFGVAGYVAAQALFSSALIDNIIISGYITGNRFGGLALVRAQRTAVTSFRKRLKQQGMARLEVNVRKADATLVRNVVRALVNPQQEQAARTLLREHFGSRQVDGLKALLAAAPLEGINLSRERDFGRDVNL
jgi:hypothetical protein